MELKRKIFVAATIMAVSVMGTARAAQAQIVGDAATGQKAFGACAACHTVKPGASSIGPNLLGVVGKKAGTNDPRFKYSAAMKAAPIWTEVQLDKFISDPKGTVPGTAMAMAPTKDAQKRADIVAYLKSLSTN